ncbi:GNAT family N-acetyltransferase [Methanolobus sp. ZRKC2]|uniref:GNAT family N-acetyltransferase n=1 Tax=Methanolobus sp. ZRKC2 TaxID=3125783 RepID=UPI003252CA14
MIELAKTSDGLSFCILEYPFELDKLKVGEFTYFKKHLGMADYMANFKSWLKRPAVFLILIISNGTIVGWSMNEKWNKPSVNSRPVFVLRAIEISPELSRRGHGRNLFSLVSGLLPGHMITKPVNENARIFFESLGFMTPGVHSPINLNDHPGYLVLSEDEKSSLESGAMNEFKEQVLSAKSKMFPKEITIRVKPENLEESDDCENLEKDYPDSPEKVLGQSQVIANTEGDFEGDQKMMTPCDCGSYHAGKFLQKDSRTGTAFVCLQCGAERYFLPLKK